MPQIKKTKKTNVLEKLESSLLSGENKSYREYAKELKIHKDTAKKYIEEIISRTPRKSIKEVEFRIEIMYDKIIRQAEDLLENAVDSDEKERYIKLVIHCHDKFIDFLERFGIKQKAPDLLGIKGEIDHKVQYEVIVKSQDEKSSN